MGYAATITKTGQITIPKWVREALGVEPGQRIVFRKTKDAVTIEREKTVDEVAAKIDELIPQEIRERHNREYGGLTTAEWERKWAESEDAKEYFAEKARRCQ